MHFPAALPVAQRSSISCHARKKVQTQCLLALATLFLKLPRHKQLCNTHTLHTGFNTKMLWDWQPPKQCGLSRGENDWNGSGFAGIGEETPDSQIKDGEHFHHRVETGLSDKTFFLEHQWRHVKEGLRNCRLTHLPAAMASGFLGCHTEFIAQTTNWATTTPLRRGERDLAL